MIGIGNTAESVTGWWLLRKMVPGVSDNNYFNKVNTIFSFFICGFRHVPGEQHHWNHCSLHRIHYQYLSLPHCMAYLVAGRRVGHSIDHACDINLD
jgi:hypothetical protein